VTLHLVRHGRPLVDPTTPAETWDLDPEGFDDVWALRDRLPQGVAWYCSPEPTAVATAQLLTDADVGIVEGLRGHRRGPGGWAEDLHATVMAAFADPDRSVHEGWEPLARCRERVVGAVEAIAATEPGDVVLVGHATAWTVLAAALEGVEPDLERLRTMAMPDVITVRTR